MSLLYKEIEEIIYKNISETGNGIEVSETANAIEIFVKQHVKYCINELIKEYHTYNNNDIFKGGQTKGIDYIALEFMKKHL